MTMRISTYFIYRAAVTVIVFMMTVAAVAVPALQKWTTRSLQDGTSIKVKLVGDEYGHWYQDELGQMLSENADGTLSYLSAAEKSEKISTRRQLCSKENAARTKRLNTFRNLNINASKGKTSSIQSFKPITGNRRGLVVLVEFPNRKFNTPNAQEVFFRRFNEEGYNQDNLIGSVHDYFYDQSYGKFDIEFDVVGPVTVSKNYNYYGQNDYNGNDSHPAEIIPEVVDLVRYKVDFSQYDWDNDDEVDQILVIYAGTGEHISGIKDEIWAHESMLENWSISKPRANRKYINTYAMTNELVNADGTLDGIGTACHEFTHCLGFPDFYNTENSTDTGLYGWSLLCSGNYNGPKSCGEVPAPYTSYERWMAGWLEPEELTSPCTIHDMKPLNDAPDAYIIYNDGNRNEYFMLENRQPLKWDSYTTCRNDGSGRGMLILHVDYNASLWEANMVNNDPAHQRMTYVSANNNYGKNYDNIPGQLFPGTTGNSSFTDTSSSAASTFNKNSNGKYLLSKPLTGIIESNGFVSFCFMGGYERPVAIEPLAIGKDSFTAAWEPVVGAISYTLAVEPKVNGSYQANNTTTNNVLLSENFAKITTTTATDITAKINSFTNISGWTGQKLYGENGTLRIGTSSTDGMLVTAPFKPTSGKITVAFKAKRYSTKDGSDLLVYLTAPSSYSKYADDDGRFFVNDVTLSTEWQDYVMHFDINSLCSLYFEGTKRVYFDDIRVFDGDLTEAEVNNTNSAASASAGESLTLSSDGGITVTGINATNYSLTGLDNSTYRYRVKALTPDGYTDWSDYIEVHLSSTDINVQPQSGISSNAIYSVTGQYLGTDISRLASGIYIVNGRKFRK